MRTTLTIDDDVFRMAKEIASLRNESIGKVLSELARAGLRRERKTTRIRNGVPLLPERPGEGSVTLEDVNRLLDEAFSAEEDE